MIPFFLLLSCAETDIDTADTAPERGVDLLPLPDMSGMDLKAAANEALSVALGITTTQVWQGHTQALELGSSGCPDLYLGDPVEPEEDSSYLGWSDGCVSGQNVEFVGDARWTSAIQGSESGGQTIEGERELLGDVLIRDTDQTFYSFSGRASDSLLSIVDLETEFSRWTYRSSVDGTLRGSIPFTDSVHPEGHVEQVFNRLRRPLFEVRHGLFGVAALGRGEKSLDRCVLCVNGGRKIRTGLGRLLPFTGSFYVRRGA